MYIADYNNNRIRKVVVTSGAPGMITTIAGTGTASFSGDGGAATSATLNSPKGLTLDSAGTTPYEYFVSISLYTYYFSANRR